jgi:hypothetical protein
MMISLLGTARAQVTGMGPIFPVSAAAQIAARADGTVLLVDALNTTVGPSGVQRDIINSQIGFGQTNQGLYHGFTSLDNTRFYYSSPDVAVSRTNAIVTLVEKVAVYVGDTDEFAVRYYLVGPDGIPNSSVFPVSSPEAWTYDPTAHVAMNERGQFAIVWYDQEYSRNHYARARIYDANGQPIGNDEITLNDQPRDLYSAYLPSVAIAPDGSTVFVWEDAFTDRYNFAPAHNIFARRVDTLGKPLDTQFQVNHTLDATQSDARVVFGTNGTFVVVWLQSESEANGIHLQRFDAAGAKLGPELRVSPYNATAPQLAAAADGRFVVAWQGIDNAGTGVFAQRFLSDGSFYGRSLWLNEGANATNQTDPRIALTGDGTIFAKWSETTNQFARWIAWDATNQARVSGPRVQTIWPGALTAGSLSNLMVVFDREMIGISFNSSRVQLKNPIGTTVRIEQVEQLDGRTFELHFARQSIAGTYDLLIGPGIRDEFADLMDENGNNSLGEKDDVWHGQFEIAPGQPARLPVMEDFEGDPATMIGWSFESSDSSRIAWLTNRPYSGHKHLQWSTNRTMSATLLVDLSGYTSDTNLFLNFWARNAASYVNGFFRVEMSGDAQHWSVLSISYPGPGAYPNGTDYLEYAIDLNHAAAASGLSLSSPVQIRFVHSGDAVDFDMVQIRPGNMPRGPKVLFCAPSHWDATNSLLDRLEITFDQPISPNTFTVEDIAIRDPWNQTLKPLSMSSLPTSGNRTFMVTISPQSLRGIYSIIVGPQLLNSDGHAMNQNGDAVNGEKADRYLSSVVFVSESWTPDHEPILLHEGFETGLMPENCWSFASIPSGSISIQASDSKRGINHLSLVTGGEFSPVPQWIQSAILRLNLSAYVDPTNLFLEFWSKQDISSWGTLTVEGSNDGQGWKPLFTASPGLKVYTRDQCDLNEMLKANKLSLGANLYLRFTHSVRSSVYGSVFVRLDLDDVRISTVAPTSALPPYIEKQPRTIYAEKGSSIAFSTVVSGTAPLAYQWFFNGTTLAGQTNATLALTNVEPSQSGGYQLTVTNQFGTDKSAIAILGGLNDDFADRLPVAGSFFTQMGLNLMATSEPGEPSTACNSVWWSWTAPDSGLVTVSTLGSSFDNILAIFTGSDLASLTQITLHSDASSLKTNEVGFMATAGTEYQIMVSGLSTSIPPGQSCTWGTIQLNLSSGDPRLDAPSWNTNGVIEFQSSGPWGSNCVIQASSDLYNWIPIQTNAFPMSQPLRVQDTQAPSYPHRFYRVLLKY